MRTRLFVRLSGTVVLGCTFCALAVTFFLADFANAQSVPEKNKIICDHAAPPRGMHYVCKSQCDCHLEGKLKNDEDGLAPASDLTPPQDVKITTVNTTEMNHIFHGTTTIYVHGERSRMDSHGELPDGEIHEQGFIHLCDLHQAIELDPQKREYRTVELGDDGLVKGWQKRISQEETKTPKHGGTVEIIIENTDTHETKNILGHLAHHWITKEQRIPSAGACTQAEESETDGWYIDFSAPPSSCRERVMQKNIPANAKVNYVLTTTQDGCMDTFKFTGEQMKHGMPVLVNYTFHLHSRTPDGKPEPMVTHSKMEVTEINREPLDPKTFEVPAGYKRVARLATDVPPRTIGERFELMWEELKIALGR